jgi:hypothetical protein
LDGGKDADEVMLGYYFLAILENANAATIQVEVSLISIIG